MRKPRSDKGISIAKPADQLYRGANGLVIMCMCCRRTRRNLPQSDRWDFVKAYATTAPARTSHGICRDCLEAGLLGGVETSPIPAERHGQMSRIANPGGIMFVKQLNHKLFQLSVDPINPQERAGGDLEPIKARIRQLARQLWLKKRHATPRSDVSWLIDGRLMHQLKGLSEDKLLRVNGLLTKTVAGLQSR